MIPILFEHDETEFKTHGIGDLVDCISCETTCNSDGEYELSLKYTLGSELLQELTIGRQIYAKANTWHGPQIFRIYGYKKETGRTVEIKAQHISYDLAYYPVKAFTWAKTDTQQAVIDKMLEKTSAGAYKNVVSVPGQNIADWTFTSTVTEPPQLKDDQFKLESPTSIRSALLSGDNSIRGAFGGDLVCDNRNISLHQMAGEDRGVVIEYGVDLIDFDQEENISEMVTGVLPYYKYSNTVNGVSVDRYQYGDIHYALDSEGNPRQFAHHQIAMLDMTEYFPNQASGTFPTVKQINDKTDEWVQKSTIGEPTINLTVSYASLNQDVRLHDAVTVRFVKMGIDVKSKVTSYKFDVLKERMKEVQVGKTKESILFSLEDASRLKKGLLPPKRIGAKSVGGGQIDDKAIHEWHIGDEAVTTSAIKDGAVEIDKLDEPIQEELLKIPDFEAEIGHINKLFSGVAQIDDVWAKAFHGNTGSFASYITTPQIVGWSETGGSAVYSPKVITDGNGNRYEVWGRALASV